MEYINGRPCKACVSVEDMMRMSREAAKKKGIPTDKATMPTPVHSEQEANSSRREDCPVDKDKLGRSTWNLLHTMTVYYPDKPSMEEQQAMKNTVESLSKVGVFIFNYTIFNSRRILVRIVPKISVKTSKSIQLSCQVAKSCLNGCVKCIIE
jgi:FAD-linked sulfhydryl oxidase